MLFFRNDYGKGCIPEILELLNTTNNDAHIGYGQDSICERAKEVIHSKMPDCDVDIHFITGGTLTNLTMIRSVLRSYEAVIACDTAHIATHETGSIEATGHKVITVPNTDGKITAKAIRECVLEHQMSLEHMVFPKMVYISNATELGTVYTREELLEIRHVCDEFHLYLMLDGARLGCALMSGIDYSLNDLASWCDLMYIGGTKNGALFGEAVILSNDALKPYFRYVMKQSGAMLAKGWLLGLQFLALFENDAFYHIAEHANECAKVIQDCADQVGYPFFMKNNTNQVFLVLEPEEYQALSEKVDFEIWTKQDDKFVIRLVTSWATSMDDINHLCTLLRQIKI